MRYSIAIAGLLVLGGALGAEAAKARPARIILPRKSHEVLALCGLRMRSRVSTATIFIIVESKKGAAARGMANRPVSLPRSSVGSGTDAPG